MLTPNFWTFVVSFYRLLHKQFASKTKVCFAFLIISEWDLVVKSLLVNFNELACPFFYITFMFLFFSILLSLFLIPLHQLFLPLFIPQYISFYSSLPPSLVLYWSEQYWLSFEWMTTFSAINNLTYNDLSCLCYDAYMLQPLALWIESHTLSILKRKLKKEEFGRHFISFCSVWQYRSCVSQCYCSVSKASHSALVAKWPVLSFSLLCL